MGCMCWKSALLKQFEMSPDDPQCRFEIDKPKLTIETEVPYGF